MMEKDEEDRAENREGARESGLGSGNRDKENPP